MTQKNFPSFIAALTALTMAHDGPFTVEEDGEGSDAEGNPGQQYHVGSVLTDKKIGTVHMASRVIVNIYTICPAPDAATSAPTQ
ncbi:MAG: hypothetical protein RSE62_03320 [Citrobacter sp.]